MKYNYLLFLFFVLFLYSCSEDESEPKPLESRSFNVASSFNITITEDEVNDILPVVLDSKINTTISDLNVTEIKLTSISLVFSEYSSSIDPVRLGGFIQIKGNSGPSVSFSFDTDDLATFIEEEFNITGSESKFKTFYEIVKSEPESHVFLVITRKLAPVQFILDVTFELIATGYLP